jgi:hypothetical protein
MCKGVTKHETACHRKNNASPQLLSLELLVAGTPASQQRVTTA